MRAISTESPWVTADPRINAQIETALAAICHALPFLEPDDVLSPATGDNPTAFARQVFVHLLVVAFLLPKKRLASFGGVSLNKVKLACRSIDRRASSRPRFAIWLAGLEADAISRFRRSDWFDG